MAPARRSSRPLERKPLVQLIASLVGDDVLRLTDLGRAAWPALGLLTVGEEIVPVALFTSNVGLGGRENRLEIERRFQNPGDRSPIVDPRPERWPLLLGLWRDDAVIDVHRALIVSADPLHRMGGDPTRWSAFPPLAVLVEALQTGWAFGENSDGEQMRSFVPSLLPLSVAADRYGVEPSPLAVRAAIDASGMLTAAPSEVGPAAERARRAAIVPVRDGGFSKRVRDAYGGRCAMCGLGAGLVQGAHVHPVAAAGSVDETWNGLALCGTHHLAFDAHLVAVLPATREIVFHPDLLALAATDAAVAALTRGTFALLTEPSDPRDGLQASMLKRRYQHFPGAYAWLSSG